MMANIKKNTVLHLAYMSGHKLIARDLIRHGAHACLSVHNALHKKPVDLADGGIVFHKLVIQGLVHEAVRERQLPFLEDLLANQGDPKEESFGYSALHAAYRNRCCGLP